MSGQQKTDHEKIESFQGKSRVILALVPLVAEERHRFGKIYATQQLLETDVSV
jgi:hypothetical protein